MLGVEFNSRTIGEVLADVKQPVSHLRCRLAKLLHHYQWLIRRFVIAVSSCTPIRHSVVIDTALPCVDLTRDIPPPRTIPLQPHMSALQPLTSLALIINNCPAAQMQQRDLGPNSARISSISSNGFLALHGARGLE